VTPPPSPGAVSTASPPPSAIVGLFQREDAPFEGIGFSEGGVWTEYKSAKAGRHHRFKADGVVATLEADPGGRVVYVLSGDEIVAVRAGRVLRYKRVMLFDVGRPTPHPRRSR